MARAERKLGRPAGGAAWGNAPGYAAPQQAPAAAGGGGFMKSALATAAGVAGGMLLANSIFVHFM